jgi:hypothetical protein
VLLTPTAYQSHRLINMTTRLATRKKAHADFIEAHQFWALEADKALLNQREDLGVAFSAQSELAWHHLNALVLFKDQFPDPDLAPNQIWFSFIQNCINYFDAADDVFQLGEDEAWGIDSASASHSI